MQVPDRPICRNCGERFGNHETADLGYNIVYPAAPILTSCASFEPIPGHEPRAHFGGDCGHPEHSI